ncbi:hypothetical protein PV328_008355 [Microctonus aethiopoides]|uniref:Uncharacterized protein n=1 Tax=Microctonus aethiopoides TaxID=144406 RepID=A0AA39KR03_9HYME|nr:hypothetical protein PV328_008355 [Microctonus aethiopoides]
MIVEDLSREEKKFLEFVPPHAHDYDEILIKNFDLIEFHDSVMRIGRLREEDINEYGRKVCPRCECVKKRKKLVNNAVNDDDDEGHDVAGNESPMSLQDVKQKEKEEENSDTNNQEAPTTATAVTDVNVLVMMKKLYIL